MGLFDFVIFVWGLLLSFLDPVASNVCVWLLGGMCGFRRYLGFDGGLLLFVLCVGGVLLGDYLGLWV